MLCVGATVLYICLIRHWIFYNDYTHSTHIQAYYEDKAMQRIHPTHVKYINTAKSNAGVGQ